MSNKNYIEVEGVKLTPALLKLLKEEQDPNTIDMRKDTFSDIIRYMTFVSATSQEVETTQKQFLHNMDMLLQIEDVFKTFNPES